MLDYLHTFLIPEVESAPGTVRDELGMQLPLIQDPRWRQSLFLAQHPLAPGAPYASTVLGGVWTRADDVL